MPGRFTIEEPAESGLLPGMQMLAQAIQNAHQQRRSQEYLDFERQAAQRRHERESAAMARQKEQDKFNRAVAAWNARGEVHREARRSPSAANLNPYGYHFEEETTRPSLKSSGVNIMGGKAGQYGEHAADELSSHGQIGTEGAPNQVSLKGLRARRHIGAAGPAQASIDLIAPDEDLDHDIYEGPQQAVEGPRGRVLIPTRRPMDADQEAAIREGIVPLGAAIDEGPDSAASRLESNFSPAEDMGRAVSEASMAGRAGGIPDDRMVSLMDDPTLNEPITADVPGTPEAPGMMGQVMAADDTTADGTSEGDPYDPIKAAQALLGGPGKRRVFGTFMGQRYELPEANDTLGLGETYDTMYRNLLASGEDENDARKYVLAEHKADKIQGAISGRAREGIKARDLRQEDQQTFGREMGLSREDRLTEAQKNRDAAMARAKVGGQYRVAASAPTLKIDTANRQDIGALRAGFKEWKNTINLAIDSKSHKRLTTAMQNLDSGNAMQEREAAESLVAIFKGGGQVTKASQDLLLKHLAGIVGDVETWFQHMATGNFGSRELNVLKTATRNALKEEQEKLHLYHESAVDTFGPGSGWEQLGGNVNALVKGAFRQFGYDSPSIYPETAEPVVLGSGQRPKTPAQQPKPAAKTVTIRNKKTGETKQVSVEEARRMGAAP